MMKGYGKSRYYADKAFFVDRQAAGATLQKRWPQMRDDFSLVLEREKAGPHWLALGGLIDGKKIMPYTDGEKWWKTWSLMMIEHTLVKKGLGRDADLMAMVDGNGAADLHARAKAYAGQGKHSIWGLQAICLFQEDPEGDGELPRDGEHDDEIDEGNAKLGNLRAFYGKSAMVLLGKPGVVDKKLRTLLSGGWMQDKTWGISDFKVESLAHLPQRSVREKKQKDANCERADYSTLTFWTAEVMRRGDEMLEALFGGTQYEGKITYADLSDQWKQEDKQKWDEQLTPEERSKLRLGGSKLQKTPVEEDFGTGQERHGARRAVRVHVRRGVARGRVRARPAAGKGRHRSGAGASGATPKGAGGAAAAKEEGRRQGRRRRQEGRRQQLHRGRLGQDEDPDVLQVGKDGGLQVRRPVQIQAWRPVRHRAEGRRQLAQQEGAGGRAARGVADVGGANGGAGRVQEEASRGQEGAKRDTRVGLRRRPRPWGDSVPQSDVQAAEAG